MSPPSPLSLSNPLALLKENPESLCRYSQGLRDYILGKAPLFQSIEVSELFTKGLRNSLATFLQLT